MRERWEKCEKWEISATADEMDEWDKFERCVRGNGVTKQPVMDWFGRHSSSPEPTGTRWED